MVLHDYTPEKQDGPVMCFAWGNGFPAEMYLPLVNGIDTSHRKICLPARSWWPGTIPDELENWGILVRDYIAGIEAYQLAPVVGIGHSMGAMINLMAAVYRPELFKAIVLLDPLFFPHWLMQIALFIEKMGIKLPGPLVKGALQRQDHWNSIEEAYQYFRGKPLFKRCSDEVVRLYTQHITTPGTNGVKLRYPKIWEAQIYRTTPLDGWRYPPKIQIPCLIIAGEKTSAFRPGAAHLWQRLRPDIPLITIPETSHLMPVEQPEVVAKQIQEFLIGR